MFDTDFSGLICLIPSISTINKKTIIQICFETQRIIRLRGLGSRNFMSGVKFHEWCPKPEKRRLGHWNLLTEVF